MRSRPSGLVRLLLWLLPRDFREEYGDEVEAFWVRQAAEPRYRGLLGRLRLGRHILVDIGRSGLALGAGRFRDNMSEIARPLGLVADMRYAIRSLTRAPMFSAVAILTLALGVGATTALFSVVNGVLLKPLPFPESEQLVRIERVSDEGVADDVAWPDFSDWRDQGRGFVGMAAHAETQSAVTWDDLTETLDGALVTRDYFEVMGIPPALGRAFLGEEDRLEGTDAVIISHGLWQSRWGADPQVLGRTLIMEGEPVPIVGVMPAGFSAPTTDLDFWVPLQGDELLARVGLPTGTRSLSFLTVTARLGAADLAVAERDLATLAGRIDVELGREDEDGVRLVPLHATVVGDVRGTLWLLMSAVLLVMLAACANVAGLSISRAATREGELAVRSAIGARPADLFRLVAIESLVLAAVAGALGMALAVGLTRAVIALAPPGLPRLDEIGLAPTDLLFALALTAAAALLFGIAPSWRAMGTSLRRAMSGGERAGGRRRQVPERVLVVMQVATSVVLLSAAALLGNSLLRLMNVERGFSEQGVLVAGVEASTVRYSTPEQFDIFFEELLARVRAIPGVEAATTTFSPPLSGNDFRTRIRLEDEPEREEEEEGRWAGTIIVRDDYFRTTGTPLIQGREFGPQDRLGEPLVVIVNRTMAETFWPGQDPIGQRFHFAGGLSGSAYDFSSAYFPREPYTVVGVAGDIRRTSLAEVPEPEYYRPHRQITWGFQYLMVRTSVDPDQVSGALREAIRAHDPTTPVPEVRKLSEQVSQSLATPRFRTLLLAGFAGLACLLAMLGLYSVMALAVSRRTREMGVRLALGATPPTLLRGVLKNGARLAGLGIVLGLAVSYVGTRWIASMLYEVESTDPGTYAAVVVSVALVALLACYAPARRASRVDPVTSLKV